MMGKRVLLISLFIILFGLSFALAQNQPLHEAVSSCEGKSSGSDCSFTVGHHGEVVSGSCLEVPEEGILACIHGDSEIARNNLHEDPSVNEEDSQGFFERLFNFLFGWIKSGESDLQKDNNLQESQDRPLQEENINRGIMPGEDQTETPTEGTPSSSSGPGGIGFIGGDTETIGSLSLPDSGFYYNYEIDDYNYGTEVEVTLSNDKRNIIANALPNHDTGEFPNSGNPHAITEQSNTYDYPSEGSYTGNAVFTREPGVAVNGVKFEPTTGEFISCIGGESYQIEALQDTYDLGFDFNEAHVQPDGEYHYHGYPTELVELYKDGQDLVHLGFAADGNMIYYDTTGTVESSWEITSEERSRSGCTYRNNEVDIDNIPKGVFVSDWEYNTEIGNLDACNGAFVDGEYAYFVTQTYPYISRCLQGEL